jgi:hypothetical protein
VRQNIIIETFFDPAPEFYLLHTPSAYPIDVIRQAWKDRDITISSSLMKFFVGLALLITMGVVVLAIIIDSTTPGAADGLYTLIGLSFFVFGTWGGILLVKR